MANFVQLDENNVVIGGAYIDNENMLDENGVEQESIGIQYIHTNIIGSEEFTWKQCSFNSRIRGMYPGIGFIYNEVKDTFIPPCIFPSWTLDLDNNRFNPPVPQPSHYFTDTAYVDTVWNEETQSWDEYSIDVPFPSWSSDPSSFNLTTKCWTPPVPYPVDEKFYQWNEETQSWDESDDQPTYLDHVDANRKP